LPACCFPIPPQTSPCQLHQQGWGTEFFNQPVVPLFEIIGPGSTFKIWLANDLPEGLPDCRVSWTVTSAGRTLVQGARRVDAPPLGTALVETIGSGAVPDEVSVVTVSLSLADATGKLLSRYEREVFLQAWRLQDALFSNFELKVVR
jgi:hypothetical protein